MCALADAKGSRTRKRSRSRRVASRPRQTPPLEPTETSAPSSVECGEEPVSCFAYFRTIFAGIVTNILIILIFLTLKSALIMTDFANLVFSSVLFPVVSFYLLWISVHFVGSHMYVQQCVGPYNLMSLLWSPFVAATPTCAILRYGINQGGNYIMLMWCNIGIALVAFSRALILKMVNRKESTATDEPHIKIGQEIETKTITTTITEEESMHAEVICAPNDSDDKHAISTSTS